MSPRYEKVGGTRPPCPPPNCAHVSATQQQVAAKASMICLETTVFFAVSILTITYCIDCRITLPFTDNESQALRPKSNFELILSGFALSVKRCTCAQFEPREAQAKCILNVVLDEHIPALTGSSDQKLVSKEFS